jgi:hypothetical protein
MRNGRATDRRRAARFQKRTPAKVRNPKSGEEDRAAETRDLSERGLFVFTTLPLEEGINLEFVLMLPREVAKDGPKLVSCHGKVVRVERNRRRKRTGIAVAINQIQAVPQL